MISLPAPLDALLKGLEPGTITNFYGGPGTGKTNLCLLAALDVIRKQGRVIFIDTEGGFSLERLKQLAPNWEYVLKQIELVEPKTLTEQGKIIRELEKKLSDTNLIIVDSVVALYRLEYAEKVNGKTSDSLVLDANRELSKQLSILSNLAREKKIPVLITAHTFKSWDTGEPDVIGGEVLKYWSKAMIYLERTGKMSERKATITKHRYISEGGSVKFSLVNEGIKPAGFKLF